MLFRERANVSKPSFNELSMGIQYSCLVNRSGRKDIILQGRWLVGQFRSGVATADALMFRCPDVGLKKELPAHFQNLDAIRKLQLDHVEI